MLLSLQPSCPVCLRSIAVTNAVLISQHCPVTSQCPGYRHPPAFLATAVLRPQCRQPLMTPGQEDRPTRSPDLALSPRTSEKTIKRLPKALRKCAGRKLAAILGAFIDKNNNTLWMRLFRFSARCLRCPARGGCRQSLASAVNRQLREEVDPLPTARPSPVRKHRRTDDLDTRLAARVSAKLEEGDLK